MSKTPITYAFIDVIGKARRSLEYKKDQHRRSVETLGLSGHGDGSNVAKNTQNVNTNQPKKQEKK